MSQATFSPRCVAEICHEANRVLCQIQGDNSQPAWADAPDWQKDSAIIRGRSGRSGA